MKTSEPVPLIPGSWASRQCYFAEARSKWTENNEKIRALKGCHEGRRAWIVANGPSVNNMDLRPLTSEVAFAVNSTYKLYDRIGGVLPYTCFSDRIRWYETGEACMRASPGSTFFYCDNKEFPTPFDVISPSLRRNILFLNRAYWIPLWLQRHLCLRNRAGYTTYKCLIRRTPSFDITDGVCLGNSVIFAAMQIAAYMGCKEIILIGVDMDYSGPMAHFHGQKIFTPPMNYETDAKPWFLLFRDAFQKRGIRLINGTLGGKVDVLPRVDYREILGMAR